MHPEPSECKDWPLQPALQREDIPEEERVLGRTDDGIQHVEPGRGLGQILQIQIQLHCHFSLQIPFKLGISSSTACGEGVVIMLIPRLPAPSPEKPSNPFLSFVLEKWGKL